MRRHLACAGWAVAGGLLGLALVAYGQAAGPGPSTQAASAWTDVTVGQILAYLGLPTTMGAGAWWLRGVFRDGLVVTIRLADEDRAELVRARRALERHVDGSESDEGTPPAPKAAA